MDKKLLSITAEKLYEIISYEIVKKPTANPFESYRLEIKKKLKDSIYINNIFIDKNEVEGRKIPINLTTERKTGNFIGYILTISNLKIIFSKKVTPIIFDRSTLFLQNEMSSRATTPLASIQFKKCTLENKDKDIRLDNKYEIDSFTVLSFDKCEFRNLNIFTSYNTKKDDEEKSINFAENTFYEGKLCVTDMRPPESDRKDPLVENMNHNKKEFRIESRLNCSSVLNINNNTLNILQICGLVKVEFSGVNKIKEMSVKHPLPYIYWNSHQEIDNKLPSIVSSHKTLFLELKEDAKRNEDIFQTAYFHVEVVKCEHEKIRNEENKISFQENFLLNFTKYTSNYGTSWARPLWILFFLNFAFAHLILILIYLGDYCCRELSFANLFKITFSLFIPFQWETENISASGYIAAIGAILNAVHKAAYAALIYEAVKSFRRFNGK